MKVVSFVTLDFLIFIQNLIWSNTRILKTNTSWIDMNLLLKNQFYYKVSIKTESPHLLKQSKTFELCCGLCSTEGNVNSFCESIFWNARLKQLFFFRFNLQLSVWYFVLNGFTYVLVVAVHFWELSRKSLVHFNNNKITERSNELIRCRIRRAYLICDYW
jgi:hypothetical protein